MDNIIFLEIILLLVSGLLIITAYTMGLRQGQRLAKGEPIILKDLNPVQRVSRKLDTKKIDEDIEKLNKIMENIENYTGDSKGQKEVI